MVVDIPNMQPGAATGGERVVVGMGRGSEGSKTTIGLASLDALTEPLGGHLPDSLTALLTARLIDA